MNTPQSTLNRIINERMGKADNIIKIGENPFANNFYPNIICNNFNKKYEKINRKELSTIKTKFFLAGRITTIRIIGKAAFLLLQDQSGIIQLFLQKNSLNNGFKLLAMLDVGDFIGVEGTAMRTKTNQLTLRVESTKMLTKSFRPLPEKFHGLIDIEQRYRQRYLDLIVNKKTREIFINRTKIIRQIQKFLDNKNFIEVETPILINIAGGAKARPFLTHHNNFHENLSLRIATELHLKRLIIGGLEKVYEIGRIFRNEGISTKHNPEFTTIEFYQAYSTYKDLMILTEKMLKTIAKHIHGKSSFEYQGKKIDFSKPFHEISIAKLVGKYFGYTIKKCNELNKITSVSNALVLTKNQTVNIQEPLKICLEDLSDSEAEEIIPFYPIEKTNLNILDKSLLALQSNTNEFYQKLGKNIDEKFKNNVNRKRRIALHLIYAIFEHKIEHTLIQPTFVTGFSINVSPLARQKDSDNAVADRFELFCGGMEIANAFSELTNPIDQKLRFKIQSRLKKRENLEVSDIDEDFIKALEFGMPPTAGEGIGIDRLVMLLTNSQSIKDVILFPKMRIK